MGELEGGIELVLGLLRSFSITSTLVQRMMLDGDIDHRTPLTVAVVGSREGTGRWVHTDFETLKIFSTLTDFISTTSTMELDWIRGGRSRMDSLAPFASVKLKCI